MESIRIDKWLWAARFFKTRGRAQEAVGLGRVLMDGQRLKASREVSVGDELRIIRGEDTFDVVVKGISAVRGPAPVARELYEETVESRTRREMIADMRRLAPEPSRTIEKGRPTKRDRRVLERFRMDGFEE